MSTNNESPRSHSLELLAPVGSKECLHAAVCAGADAVYLGLSEFNARRNADNFTIETFKEACDYAHLRGVKVYVTLNIIILPSEIEHACALAHQAAKAGADAFIVQDVGLARRIADEIPEVELHISTQMNIHNAAGIQAAWQLGASRVTLARELSFEEVAHLSSVAADFGMETEVFGHGALCVSYSGQCLMSSMIGGRSANRGTCAQACRLPYDLCDENGNVVPSDGDHLLSPRDLCTVDSLIEMYRAGAGSLKIEGRMKSPDYVYAVTKIYREVLDRVLAGDIYACATDAQKQELAEVFTRGFSEAYLRNRRDNEIMSYGRPNNRGVFVGRVSDISNANVRIASEVELHHGDILEFWTNRGHFAHQIEKDAPLTNDSVVVRPEKAVGRGDRVFRVRNSELAFEEIPFEPRLRVKGFAKLRIGAPLYMRFECTPGDESMFEDCPLPCVAEVTGASVEAARTRAVSEEDVYAHIDRLGQTPFEFESLEIDLEDGVGIRFSELHNVRSQGLDKLRELLLTPYHRRSDQVSEAKTPERPVMKRRPINRENPCSIVACVTNPDCARAAKRAGADLVYIPVFNYRRGQAQYAGVLQADAGQTTYPKQKVMVLPAVEHDYVEGIRENKLEFEPWDYIKAEKPVYADSIGSCVRALSEKSEVEIGSHVPITNNDSVKTMMAWGVNRFWLSPELSLGQIADIVDQAPKDAHFGLTISGAQELMITEHCILMTYGPCDQKCETCRRRMKQHHLVDRKEYEFPVVTDLMGRTHIYNGIQLDVIPSIPDLIDIGLDTLMVDATLMSKEETYTAVARAVKGRDYTYEGKGSLDKVRGTTSGHLFRGVL